MPSLLGDRPFTLDRIFRIVAKLLLGFGALLLLRYFVGALTPFLIALVLAYLINPLVRRVQRLLPSRGLAMLVTIGGLLICAILLGRIGLGIAIRQGSEMARIARDLTQDPEFASRMEKILPAPVVQELRSLVNQPEVQRLLMSENLREVVQVVSEWMSPGLNELMTGALGLVGLAGALSLVLFYLVFLLADFDDFQREWRELLPGLYRPSVDAFLAEFHDAMARYFRAQAVIASIVGLIYATAFSLIGLPAGLALGLFIGLFHMVPYLHILAVAPTALIAVLHGIDSGSSVGLAIGQTLGVFAFVQLIQDYVIYPRIMGKASGLSPVVILLSLSIWGKLLGFAGVVIAIPMTCLALAAYKRSIARIGVPPELELEREPGTEFVAVTHPT